MAIYAMFPGGGGSGGGKPEQGGSLVPTNPIVTLSSYDNEIDVEWMDSAVTDVPIDYHIIYWRVGDSKPATVKDFSKSVKITSGTKYSITGLANDTTIWVCVCSVGTNGVMNASLKNVTSIQVGIAHIFTVTDTSSDNYPYNFYFMVMDFALYKNGTVNMTSLITTSNGTVDSVVISYRSQIPYFGFIHKSLYAFTNAGVQNSVSSSEYPGYVLKCPKSGTDNGVLTTIATYPSTINIPPGNILNSATKIFVNRVEIGEIDLDYYPTYRTAVKANGKYYIAIKTTDYIDGSLSRKQSFNTIGFLVLDGKDENSNIGYISTYYGTGITDTFINIIANDGKAVNIKKNTVFSIKKYHEYLIGTYITNNYVVIQITKVKDIILNKENTNTQYKAILISKNNWSDWCIAGIWQKRLYIIHRNNDYNLYLSYIDEWGNNIDVCKLTIRDHNSSNYPYCNDVDFIKVSNNLVFIYFNALNGSNNITIVSKDNIIKQYNIPYYIDVGKFNNWEHYVFTGYIYDAIKNNKVVVSRRFNSSDKVTFMIGNDFNNWENTATKTITYRDYSLGRTPYYNRKGQSTTNTEPEYIE